MNNYEKLEFLRQNMMRIQASQNALTSDLDGIWRALDVVRAELGKMAKVIATLRALWPKNYFRAG
jgi:hypothetical protein